MRRIELDDPRGVRHVPADPCGTGVLVLGGSSGRIQDSRARLLAANGAVADSIQWFGGAHQSPGPWEVPLELFRSRVQDLQRDCDRVALMGTSFGEAALVTASHTPAVHTVVAFAPSDVVWAGVRPDGTQTSHWTLTGQPLPFVAFDEQWEPDTDPPAFRDLYDLSWRKAADVAQATIAVESIPQVVLVSGGDDQVWPAAQQAERIVERRRSAGRHTIQVHHPEAGHHAILPGEEPPAGGQRMVRGGSPRADSELGARAWPHIVQVLRLNHSVR